LRGNFRLLILILLLILIPMNRLFDHDKPDAGCTKEIKSRIRIRNKIKIRSRIRIRIRIG